MKTTISFLGAAVLDKVLSKSLCFQVTQSTNPLPSHLQNDKNQCQTAFITGLLYYFTLRHTLLAFSSSNLSVRYNLHQKGFCAPLLLLPPIHTDRLCLQTCLNNWVSHISFKENLHKWRQESQANTKPAIPPASQSPEHYRENK